MAARRSCGECTACCYARGVDALTKSAWEGCKRCYQGCTVYSSRPDECKNYSCSWLHGLGPEEHRPDKTGVILDNALKSESRDQAKALSEHYGLPVLVACEVTQGAFSSEKGREVIEQAARGAILVLFRHGETQSDSIVLPREKVDSCG